MSSIEKILNAKECEKVTLTPDLCMINDDNWADDVIRDLKRVCKTMKERSVVILDHDIPAGSFISAERQKKLIKFSKDNGMEFIQSAGIGYNLLGKRLKKGMVGVSCGNHTSIWGANGALGIKLSTEQMIELLEGGRIVYTVPKTIEVNLKGNFKRGVSSYDASIYLVDLLKKYKIVGKIIEINDNTINKLSYEEKEIISSLISRTCSAGCMFNDIPDFKRDCDIEIDLYKIDPKVILPGNIDKISDKKDLVSVPINACFIGGCCGGHIEEIRKAAEILKGHRIKRGLRLLIGFVSNEVYLKAVEEGLIDIFFDCGAQVTNPGCASCKTTSIGVVGDGEVLFSTGCYNYNGCSGTEKSKIYLGAVESVAMAALTGYIDEEGE